jgi:hypothetical protein
LKFFGLLYGCNSTRRRDVLHAQACKVGPTSFAILPIGAGSNQGKITVKVVFA